MDTVYNGTYAVNMGAGVTAAQVLGVPFGEGSNGNIVFNNNGSALLTNNGTIAGVNSGGTATCLLNGTGSMLFTGVISDNSAASATNKLGLNCAMGITGIVSLTAASTYTGNTAVNSGTLYGDNTTGSGTGVGGNVTVAANGTLAGYGTIGAGTAASIVDVIGKIRPGDATNVAATTTASALTSAKAVTFEANSTLAIVMNSATLNTSTASTAASYGQLALTSAAGTGVTISPTGTLLTLALNFPPANGSQFTVIDNGTSSPISGTFSNLPDGGTLSASYGGTAYKFTANYEGIGPSGGTNDLVLTSTVVPVPEPTALAGVAAAEQLPCLHDAEAET